jgi:endonuclease YncB( thermonuclease family)
VQQGQQRITIRLACIDALEMDLAHDDHEGRSANGCSGSKASGRAFRAVSPESRSGSHSRDNSNPKSADWSPSAG